MSITAKYKAVCNVCRGAIAPGQMIEWVRGTPVRHTTCSGAAAPAASHPARSVPPKASYNPDRFNGYGNRRGGRSRACHSGGNCSSIGAGRSCGAHDCDGY